MHSFKCSRSLSKLTPPPPPIVPVSAFKAYREVILFRSSLNSIRFINVHHKTDIWQSDLATGQLLAKESSVTASDLTEMSYNRFRMHITMLFTNLREK